MIKAFCFFAPYTLSYLLSLGVAFGFLYGGWSYYSGLFLFFGLHPLLDNLFFKNLKAGWLENSLGDSPKNFSDKIADFLLLLALPCTSLLVLLGLFIARGLTAFEMTGLILSTGAVMGVLGINIAHELVHRREKALRAAGVYLLLLCNFAHWGIAHVVGHHKNVATPEDPATARKNESVYAFWWRTYFGGLRESFLLENKRLKSWRQFYRHRVLWYLLISLSLTTGVFLYGGPEALLFWLGQSVVAILLLQTADYIEHYGLLREKNPQSPFYEAMKPYHAWDSYQAFTNFALMKLGFHSHHHLKTILHYPQLQEQDLARQLPYGYSAMALLALVPRCFLE